MYRHLAAGDGGDDEQRVVGSERRIEVAAIANVIVIDEDVDVTADAACFVADSTIDGRVEALQSVEGGANGVGSEGEGGDAAAVGAEVAWDVDVDRGGGHVTGLASGLPAERGDALRRL